VWDKDFMLEAVKIDSKSLEFASGRLKKNKTIIIAEAGVNHNGNMNLAYKLIDIAAESKADYIKFQTYSTDDLVQKKNWNGKIPKKKIKKNIFSI
jgi:sialic acid synthase SpsE